MSIENPVIYVPIRHLATAIVAFRSNYLPAYKALYLRAYKAPDIYVPIRHYICREPSTNQLLFMQNKPNFRKSQMNVKSYNTKDYENIANWTIGENKPNSNPIKPNFRKAQMNVNLTLTKDYRKKDDFAVQKNKAKTNPISQRVKIDAKCVFTKDYEENCG